MKSVDNFFLTKMIGQGAYGAVYQCKIRHEEKIEPETKKRMRDFRRVACKMIKQKNIKKKIKKYLIQEIEIMMTIEHPNILRFLEAKKTKNNIYIFVEFCNGGDLRRFLDLRGGKLDEKLTSSIVKQIANGICHLNEHNAMHRDLKLDNILLNFPDFEGSGIATDEYIENFDLSTDEIEVIIGDLGFARSIGAQDMATSYCGTPLNMAPEIMNGHLYNSKVDIWSLGTMMYELLVGFAPFTGRDPHDLAERVNKGDYGVPKNIKLTLQCIDLLNKCLQHDPTKRINHQDVLEHPFLETQEESEEIDLYVSRGPGQKSFFESPADVEEINSKNATMLNVGDSCLFNQHYNKSLKKFAARQQKGEEVLQEYEVPDVSDNNLCDAEIVENDDLVDFEDKNNNVEDSKKSDLEVGVGKRSEEEFKLIEDSKVGYGLDTDEEVKGLQVPEFKPTPTGFEEPSNEVVNDLEINQPEEVKMEADSPQKTIEDPVVPQIEEHEFLKEDIEAPPAKEEPMEEVQKEPFETSQKDEEKAFEPESPQKQNISVENSLEKSEEKNSPPKEEKEVEVPQPAVADVEAVEEKHSEALSNMSTEQQVKAMEMLNKLSIEEPIEEVEDPAPQEDSDEEEKEQKSENKEEDTTEQKDELPLDFTIVDKKDAADATLEDLQIAPAKRDTVQMSVVQEEAEPEGDLDCSFEVVHFHDIYLLPDGEYNNRVS